MTGLRKNIRLLRVVLFWLVLYPLLSFSQAQVGSELDPGRPKQYVIGGLAVTGLKFLDENVLKNLFGIAIGDTVIIPGERISRGLDNLWKEGLFSDIKIIAWKTVGQKIFLELRLQERPRLSKFSFKGGVSKSDEDKLRKKINPDRDYLITGHLIASSKNTVRQYYADKGYTDTEVTIDQYPDSVFQNKHVLTITVDKKEKVKIEKIIFHGTKEIKAGKLRRAMKDTREKRWWKVFTSSKFVPENYEKDKANVIVQYANRGFKDARIVFDTIYKVTSGKVNIEITIDEGRKYYFRNITWKGNTKYSTDTLNQILGIKKGDGFEQSVLDERLYTNPNGKDISSLYLDSGYLFFRVTPVEINMENDSIDMEIRIYEGRRTTVKKVTVTGNVKTHDHVLMREVRTRPGQLFNHSDIIRTQRELAQLPYINPEKLNVHPKPDPADGTVDVEYVVEEKSSDMLEVSGGYGANRFVGSVGYIFNNFSLRNIWRGGDGQRLSLRAQADANGYHAFNVSFTEPWLGGKKPNSFSVAFFHSLQSNGKKTEDPLRESLTITGGSVGFGTRLKWPDDYFTIYGEAGYKSYSLNNFSSMVLFNNGKSNDISLSGTLSRNSLSHPVYTREGSRIILTGKFTFPYSYFNDTDYKTATPEVKYKMLEYHKWKFNASWYTPIGNQQKLVLNARIRYGFLGYYNSDIGAPPFERFYMGGSGLSGFTFDGRDIIALRGYKDNALTPTNSAGYVGGTVFEKYTLEMRYPLSLDPHATVFILGFVEGGDDYLRFKEFNPFKVKRSAGVGVRIFLPIFGLIGVDWGYGFDDIPNSPPGELNHWQLNFFIGYQIDELLNN